MSWRTLVSRSGVSRWPRKYLLTTTLVASCDQKVGTSTFFCSKTLLPVSLRDAGGPVLPGDLVVRVDAGGGPAALERQALGRLGGGIGAVEAGPVWAGVATRFSASCVHSSLRIRPRPDCRSLGPSAVSSPHPAVAAAPSSSVVRRGSLGRLAAASIGWREPRIRVFSGDVATRLRYASSGRASSPKTQDVVVGSCRADR